MDGDVVFTNSFKGFFELELFGEFVKLGFLVGDVMMFDGRLRSFNGPLLLL